MQDAFGFSKTQLGILSSTFGFVSLLAVTGTATGVISVIGYTPDIFMPTLGGMILDANPGAGGYQNLFLFVTALSFLGLIAAFVVYRKVQCKPAVAQYKL